MYSIPSAMPIWVRRCVFLSSRCVALARPYINDKKKISEIISIKELASGDRFDLGIHFINIQKVLLENISLNMKLVSRVST